jgi:SAM-dependent methyltransferase
MSEAKIITKNPESAAEGKGTVSPELSSFYSDCYKYSEGSAGKWQTLKRELAARDSVSHIKALIGSHLGSVVEVGAGEGSVLARLAQEGLFDSISALEISASGLEAINARNIPGLSRTRQFDGYIMPFCDNEFDTAICVHVIEHVEHERQFIRELGRVAKRVFIEIPLEGGARGRVNCAYGHINYYTPRFFLNLLETSGMKPIGSKVVTSSRALEAHCYGTAKGTVKNIIRRSVLNIAGPNLAPHLMTFLMAVVCEKEHRR